MNLPMQALDKQKVARILFDTGCVQVRRDEPFRLPSGWASPIYMDCRKLISYPATVSYTHLTLPTKRIV